MSQEERRHFIFFKKSEIYLSNLKCNFRVFVSLTSFQSTTDSEFSIFVFRFQLQRLWSFSVLLVLSSSSFLLPCFWLLPFLFWWLGTGWQILLLLSPLFTPLSGNCALANLSSFLFFIFWLIVFFWIRLTGIINKRSTPIVCSWSNYIKSIKEQPKQNLSLISLINYLKIG